MTSRIKSTHAARLRRRAKVRAEKRKEAKSTMDVLKATWREKGPNRFNKLCREGCANPRKFKAEALAEDKAVL